MELVRSVRLSLCSDYAAQCFGHEIALRNSSQSRTPYAILSQRPSGSDSGVISAITQRDTSSARSRARSVSAISTRTSPHKASRPSDARRRRYQLNTELRDRGETRNTEERSPCFNPSTTRSASPSTYNVRWLLMTPTAQDDVATLALPLIPPSMNSGASDLPHHASASRSSSRWRSWSTARSARSSNTEGCWLG